MANLCVVYAKHNEIYVKIKNPPYREVAIIFFFIWSFSILLWELELIRRFYDERALCVHQERTHEIKEKDEAHFGQHTFFLWQWLLWCEYMDGVSVHRKIGLILFP